MCVNNVRSQREIHLGVSSFRVFFLFCFFFFSRRERERASDDTESLFLSPFGRRERFFETDFGEKKDFKEKRSSSGLLFVLLRVSLLEERERARRRGTFSIARVVQCI